MSTTFRTIPLSRIVMPSRPLRARIDMREVNELARSIGQVGQLQPIVVRPIEGDRFEVVAGHKRWLAVGIAGFSEIDVAIRDAPLDASLEAAVAENTSRSDLTPLEEARAYKRMLDEHDASRAFGDVAEVAAIVGRSESYVSGRLRVASLDDAAIALHTSGRVGWAGLVYLALVNADVRERVVTKLSNGRGPIDLPTLRDEVDEASADLADAPFDVADATLSERGACGSCSRNTAVQRDLFGARDAHCLDVPCFAAKSVTSAERARDAAAAEGLTVVEGEDAERLKRSADHVALSARCYEWQRANPGRLAEVPTWGDVLRMSEHRDVQPVIAIVTEHAGIVRVERFIRARDKSRLLGNVDLGAAEEAASDAATDDPDKRAKAEAKKRLDEEIATITLRRVSEAAAETSISDAKGCELATLALLDALPSRVLEVVALRREVAKKGADYGLALSTAVRRDPSIAAGLACELAIVKGADDLGKKHPSVASEVCEALEIDVAAVRGEVKRDLAKRDDEAAARSGKGRVRKRAKKSAEGAEGEAA